MKARLTRMPAKAEAIRALTCRVNALSQRKGWAEEARACSELVKAWSVIELATGEAGVWIDEESFHGP